ncbi:uncharacterized protein AB9X84_018991 isoform 2-T3 [Acanthopagrus schlegelii]
MGRLKCLRRESGLPPKKQDTPLKTKLSRNDIENLTERRRHLPRKHYDTLSVVPEVEEISVLTVRSTNPVLPVHCKSVPHLSSPAFTENPRGKAVSPSAPANKKCGRRVSPAGRQAVQMTPDAEAFKGGERHVNEDKQNSELTSSSMESDTAFSSDDEEEEDSSASSASSSLSSPEIFRKETYVETLTFPFEEEALDLHLHIKNSTLLDLSNAESIHMHHPPNLSTIIDASTILAEKDCEIKGPEAETKTPTDSFKPDKAFKCKTTPKLTNRRPILCKKRVWFKSPMVAETSEAKHIPATKLNIHNTGEPDQTSSQAEQMKPDTDASRAGEINHKEEALQMKSPFESNLNNAEFFDFIDDSDRDAFFRSMRERCVRLKSFSSFPLTAAKHIL